jgi:guanine nucleotide-binding protein alpha-1 subunit
MLHARRPPSVYSQEDPLAFAIRPPDAESELDRNTRLQSEADAKRISEVIDEQIKIDKRNYEKSKQDVRVCPTSVPLVSFLTSPSSAQLLLLGQAESGKSTLQKQFQLMYSPDTLDQERASWRTVIYFNVTRSVKRILEILDSHGDMFDEDVPDNPVPDSVSSQRTLEDLLRLEDHSSQPSRPYSPVVTESQKQIATLRLRLSPLVAAEITLADRLSGGVRVSGSGKDSVYVRHGWQLRSATSNAPSTSRSRAASGPLTSAFTESGNIINVYEVVEEVGRILAASKEDIKALWRSDVVQKMIKRRRLRLEEWAELYAFLPMHCHV